MLQSNFMSSEQDFIEIIGQRFWRHIIQDSELPFEPPPPYDRREFLKDLFKKISDMNYTPSPPRGFIVSNKANLVVRFVPTLSIEDYCVYFYCIKRLEDYIAENRVLGTYGGWKLGGKLRTKESLDESAYAPDNTYNLVAWKKNWTDFQNRAFNLYSNKKYKYFIKFDIANFYDSIRLELLENRIRAITDKKNLSVVNLLFYFLKNQSSKNLQYETVNFGLPQDEVGDCSRILANFYLQDYDKYLYIKTENNQSAYLRFADDQIIASRNKKTARLLLYLASKALIKIGLNLNAHKAKLMTRKEFLHYWAFDILHNLEDKNNTIKLNKAVILFKKRIRQRKIFKEDTVIRRLLSCNLSSIKKNNLKFILKHTLKNNVLINLNSFYLSRIFNILHKSQRKAFIKKLNFHSNEVLFNQYHLRVLKFAKIQKLDVNFFRKVSQNLRKLNNY